MRLTLVSHSSSSSTALQGSTQQEYSFFLSLIQYIEPSSPPAIGRLRSSPGFTARDAIASRGYQHRQSEGFHHVIPGHRRQHYFWRFIRAEGQHRRLTFRSTTDLIVSSTKDTTVQGKDGGVERESVAVRATDGQV